MPSLFNKIFNRSSIPQALTSVDERVDVGQGSKRNLRDFPTPAQLQRLRQDVQSWREAIGEAELAWFPQRIKMQRMYVDVVLDGHVAACWERRKDLTLLRKWEFTNKDGVVDQVTTDLFVETVNGKTQNKKWFDDFISYSLDTIMFGYTLVTLGDIIGSGFPELNIVRRWNVSPDRFNVTRFVYSLSGANFLDEPYKNWHVYIDTPNEIGSSICGFGLLYKIAIYQIFLRNLLGYNGNYVELFAQPFRHGKTTKTNEAERAEFEGILREMGSSGWAVTDPTDEIEFLEAKSAGTGYKAYDNLELRLEKKISKLILGHADAMDSTPGKLGGGQDGETSPVAQALNDKGTKDGSFITAIVNGKLIENMRNLGFSIPIETVAQLKNDGELVEARKAEDANNAVTATIALTMKSAGLKMDAKYFEERTGIKTEAIEDPKPVVPGADDIDPEDEEVMEDDADDDSKESIKRVQNKLKSLYAHNHSH